MAIEYVSINEIKTRTKKKASSKELTIESVRDSICDFTLAVLKGEKKRKNKEGKEVIANVSEVLAKDLTAAKTWYLTMKYGVMSVSGVKISNVADEKAAIAEAISYINKVKSGMGPANVRKDIEGAFTKKKEALASADKTRKAKKKA